MPRRRNRFWEWVVVRSRERLLLAMFHRAWGEREKGARTDQGLGSWGAGGEAPRKQHLFPWSPWHIVQELSEAREDGDSHFLLEGHTV